MLREHQHACRSAFPIGLRVAQHLDHYRSLLTKHRLHLLRSLFLVLVFHPTGMTKNQVELGTMVV